MGANIIIQLGIIHSEEHKQNRERVDMKSIVTRYIIYLWNQWFRQTMSFSVSHGNYHIIYIKIVAKTKTLFYETEKHS